MRQRAGSPGDQAGERAATSEAAAGKVSRSERIYRRAAGPGETLVDPAAALARTEGQTGAALPATAQDRFERSLGADLSSVRVHTGPASAQAASELGARAFTTGQDIHFGAGQYQPDDPFGLHLLAHEVAHTAQQQGGDAGPRAKLEVTAPQDACELDADRAADAMVTGAPASVGRAAPQVARQAEAAEPSPAAPEAPAAATAPTSFVPFTAQGTWSGADVVAALRGLATVPPGLEAAIVAGVRATALYCIDLRSAVNVAAGDPARQKACEAITRALTSRINELTYATSRSPLQYGQLADVARWAAEFPFGDAAEAAPPAPTLAASDPVEAHAARLAGSGGAYIHGGKDVERRNVKVGPNQESDGSEASPPLPGYRFIRNPFDNTVVAVRPDGTGTQYTYEAVASEGEVQLRLAHTVELSAQRVRTLARMDQAALGEKQEDEAGRKKRLANDQATGDQKRAEWAARSSDNAAKLAEYHQQLAEYNALSPEERKTRKPPVLPAGAPKNPTTTNCPNWCTPAYRAGGGDGAAFPFTPPKDGPAFYTLARRPEGPRPGDVYWLEFTAGGSTAHMGVFKSRAPAAGLPGQETWVVTDGGQGGYQGIQVVVERTRGPFDPSTGWFGDTADSGQQSGKRYLAGWIDIEEHNRAKQPEAAAEEESTST